MPDLYFIKKNTVNNDRNALDKEVRLFVEENLSNTLCTKEQMEAIHTKLKSYITEVLNPRFKAVQKKIIPSDLRFYDIDGSCMISFHEGLNFIAYKVKNNQIKNLTDALVKEIFQPF